MSVEIYRIRKYETTHENEFFRSLALALRKQFSGDMESIILIGNLSCNGDELDAVLLKAGMLAVLEFKNYGGRLQFSENGQWIIEAEKGRRVFVQGGRAHNPFQQAKAFRNSFLDRLQSGQNELFHGRGPEFQLRHASAIVLFHRPIELINPQDLPGNAPFFKLSDARSFTKLVDDLHSARLRLSKDDLARITAYLGVTEQHQYDPAGDSLQDGRRGPSDAARPIEVADRFLTQIENDGPDQPPFLKYCSAMLELESRKEGSLLSKHPVLAAVSSDKLSLDVQLSSSPGLLQDMQKNINSQFPKNLYGGVVLAYDGREDLLLLKDTPILNLDDRKSVRLSLDELELHEPTLRDMELPDEALLSLSEELRAATSFEEKITLLKDILQAGQANVKFVAGLIDKNLTQVATLAELRKLRKQKSAVAAGVSIFRTFIEKDKLPESSGPSSPATRIYVSEIDSAQESAIIAADSQPLTVITGPPGSGKSQVVLNIIARAIARDETVLFASKNHKAVDTVRDRMQGLLERDVFFKFGSKAGIKDELFPVWDKINANLTTYTSFDSNRWVQLSESNSTLVAEKNTILKEFAEFRALPVIIRELEKKLKTAESEYSAFSGGLGSEERRLFVEKGMEVNLPGMTASYWIATLEHVHTSAFARILFILFKKKKAEASLRAQLQSLDPAVVRLVEEQTPLVEVGLPFHLTAHRHLINLWQTAERSTSIRAQHQALSAALATARQEFDAKKTRYLELKRKAPTFTEQLRKIDIALIETGRFLLNSNVDRHLSKLTSACIAGYRNYVPEKIPRRPEDQPGFEQATREFLNVFKAVSVTNLSVRNAFPLSREMFDLLIIDEASQCDVASALPLLYRARRVVILGDPMQLQHVTQVNEYEEEYVREKLSLAHTSLNYVKNSLFSYAKSIAEELNVPTHMLDNHYRCHPDVIGFSNQYFYQRQMGRELKVNTSAEMFSTDPKGFIWYDVKGLGNAERNENRNEAEAVVNVAKNLRSRNPEASIGIATPFRHQQALLSEEVRKAGLPGLTVDTVYRFQGDEKDIIIFSTVVTEQGRPTAYRWLNNSVPYLINVGITRARSLLVIVGDHGFCLQNGIEGLFRNPLRELARYATELDAVKRMNA